MWMTSGCLEMTRIKSKLHWIPYVLALLAKVSDRCSMFRGVVAETIMGVTKLHYCPLIERILVYFAMGGCDPAKVLLPIGTDMNISRNVREGESEDVEKTLCQ